MNLFPENRKDQRLQTDAKGVAVDKSFLAHFQVPAIKATVASTTGIHATIVGAITDQIIIEDIVRPSVPRNITATAGGTITDIKAIQIIIEGTNYNNDLITETLPVFTVDTAGTVTGNKAFKTVTKITVPAHDGIGATTSIGFGEKLGIPFKLAHNTVINTYLNNVKEATAPTVTTSSTTLENNTIDLNSALNSTIVDAYLAV